MSAPRHTFAELAHWLLLGAVNAYDIADPNADLVALTEEYAPGHLDKAVTALEGGDLLGAGALLDEAIDRAAAPVEAPKHSRRSMERHQFATRQRDGLHRTAQIARALVLDAIKAGEAAA